MVALGLHRASACAAHTCVTFASTCTKNSISPSQGTANIRLNTLTVKRKIGAVIFIFVGIRNSCESAHLSCTNKKLLYACTRDVGRARHVFEHCASTSTCRHGFVYTKRSRAHCVRGVEEIASSKLCSSVEALCLGT